MASQSVVEGLPWGNSLSSDDELSAAFEAVMNHDDARLYEKWNDELELVDAPLNDPALLPTEHADAPKAEADESAATSSSETLTE
jgi:hypothetical protein